MAAIKLTTGTDRADREILLHVQIKEIKEPNRQTKTFRVHGLFCLFFFPPTEITRIKHRLNNNNKKTYISE